MSALMQWPAMVATVAASWLVASSGRRYRHWGFWLFLLSNVLWVLWGWHVHAWALIVLQFCLAAMNIRGAAKTEPRTGPGGDAADTAAISESAG